MPLFSLDDLESRTGGTVDSDDYFLIHDYLSALAVLEGGAPYTDLSDDGLLVVAGVVLGAAVRALSNPRGYESETVGPYSYTVSTGAAGGGVFTAEERRLIRLAYGRSTGAYTIRLSSPADVATS